MKRFTAIALLSLFAAAPAAYADPTPTPPGIRASIAKVRFRDDGNARRYFVVQPAHGKNSVATKVSAGVALGFLGMLAGGWVGAELNMNCGCHDPGMKGAIVGMPVGAVAGAIAGVWLASR